MPITHTCGRLVTTAVLLCATLGAASAQTGPLPTIDAPVVDLANVLSPDAETRISGRLQELRDTSGVQMSVLTITTTHGVPIEEFATDAFARWGGGTAHRNDGVLFVLAVDDRRNRIEVGYGLEPVLTDGEAMTILESIKPSLRESAYDTATLDLIDAVFDQVSHLDPTSAIAVPPIPFGTRGRDLMIIIGISWLFGVAYRLFAPKQAADTKSLYWRKALAKLPVIDIKARNIAVWLAIPALIGILFSLTIKPTYGIAYAIAWYICAALGVLAGEVYRKGPIRSAFFTAIVGTLAVIAFMNASDEPVPDAFTVGAAAVSLSFILIFITTFFIADSSGSGRGYRSGGSASSSSSSRTSSSSSSRSSSSSSRSSSWSGGGGRSGGGGASSSW